MYWDHWASNCGMTASKDHKNNFSGFLVPLINPYHKRHILFSFLTRYSAPRLHGCTDVKPEDDHRKDIDHNISYSMSIYLMTLVLQHLLQKILNVLNVLNVHKELVRSLFFERLWCLFISVLTIYHQI